MKKTLIALATLAAAGGAFAQSSVTLSGSFAFGYEATKAPSVTAVTGLYAPSAGGAPVSYAVGATLPTGALVLRAPVDAATNYRQSGLFTDTASIKLTATEDLGGGTTATAVVSAGGLVRGAGNVDGEDASLTLAGGFGSLKLDSAERANPTSFAWIAPGAYGFDTATFMGANPSSDRITYALPAMGPVTVSVNYTDRDAVAGTAGSGGSTGTVVSQPSAAIAADVSLGALVAGASYQNYMRTNAGARRTLVVAKASYDLGVAKIAGAYDFYNNAAGTADQRDTAVGISVPLGALSIGAQYGQNSVTGAAKIRGYSVGAKYELSKRTNVSASYRSYDTSANSNDNTAFRILVGHSF